MNHKNETIDIVLTQNPQTNHEHFTISSIKASEILGVNRTRLSQLTTQGIFPYERRKVDSRSRLFYRLNDLLNYQRKSSFGNLPNSDSAVKIDASVPLLPAHLFDNCENAQTHRSSKPTAFNLKSAHSLLKGNRSPTTPNLKTALALKNIQNEHEKLENLHETVVILKNQLNHIVEFITKLESQLSQAHTQKLNAKKTILRRPRSKRIFKFIKR